MLSGFLKQRHVAGDVAAHSVRRWSFLAQQPTGAGTPGTPVHREHRALRGHELIKL